MSRAEQYLNGSMPRLANRPMKRSAGSSVSREAAAGYPDHGVVAAGRSVASLAVYRRVWAREGAILSLAALCARDEELIAAAMIVHEALRGRAACVAQGAPYDGAFGLGGRTARRRGAWLRSPTARRPPRSVQVWIIPRSVEHGVQHRLESGQGLVPGPLEVGIGVEFVHETRVQQ